jgi:hypothetical protein
MIKFCKLTSLFSELCAQLTLWIKIAVVVVVVVVVFVYVVVMVVIYQRMTPFFGNLQK